MNIHGKKQVATAVVLDNNLTTLHLSTIHLNHIRLTETFFRQNPYLWSWEMKVSFVWLWACCCDDCSFQQEYSEVMARTPGKSSMDNVRKALVRNYKINSLVFETQKIGPRNVKPGAWGQSCLHRQNWITGEL